MITMDGKYQTRSGNPVRILCVDAGGGFPVVVLIGSNTYRASLEGLMPGVNSSYDLVPVPAPPELVPLDVKDIVPGCTARLITWASTGAWAPIYPTHGGSFMVGNYTVSPKQLMTHYEIQYPGSKEWNPCSKVKGS